MVLKIIKILRKKPSIIFTVAAIISGLILASNYIFDFPSDPSPLGNGLILLALGAVLISVSLVVRKLRKLDLTDAPLILGLFIGGTSVIFGILIMTGIEFGVRSRTIIGLLYIINVVITAAQIFSKK